MVLGDRSQVICRKNVNLAEVVGIFIISTFTALAAPSVTSIVPTAGPIGGGTPVTVSGTGFMPGATVKIGSVVCDQVKVLANTKVVCVTGAHAAGAVSVIVVNPGNDSNTINSLYTYNSTIDLTKTAQSDFEAAGA